MSIFWKKMCKNRVPQTQRCFSHLLLQPWRVRF